MTHEHDIDQRIVAFLGAIGHQVTVDDTVRRMYGPVVRAAGIPGLIRWRAAVGLVANAPGKTPPKNPRKAVAARVAQMKRRTAEKSAAPALSRRQKVLIEAAADRHAEAARGIIRRAREDTGSGPTWAELVDALGLPDDPVFRRHFVAALVEAGQVVCTNAPRSLDVGPPS